MNKRIFWFCVDSNGDEKMSTNPDGFDRFSHELYHNEYLEDLEKHNLHIKEARKVISYNDTIMGYDHWIEYHDPKITARTGEAPHWTYLPKGSIEKITGHKLTWEDEPIKIVEYK